MPRPHKAEELPGPILQMARVYTIELSARCLADIARMLKVVGAVNAAAAVRRAVKSTDGAKRHALGILGRAQRGDKSPNRRIAKACPRRNIAPNVARRKFGAKHP